MMTISALPLKESAQQKIIALYTKQGHLTDTPKSMLAVANVTKPTLEYDTLSVSYPISDETSFSDPYPLLPRIPVPLNSSGRTKKLLRNYGTLCTSDER